MKIWPFLGLVTALLLTSGLRATGNLAPQPSLQFPEASCSGEGATMTFSWQPVANATQQWLDLSTFDNGFAPGSFIGAGPFSPTASSFTWSGILPGVPQFWRVNALTASGWVSSETSAFVPCGGPALLSGPVTCTAPDTAAVTFRWAPASPAASVQWLDLTLFDNGFVAGTFLGAGPLAPDAQTFTWTGLRANVTHYFRVNALTASGWVSSDTGTFLAECGPSGVDVSPGLRCGVERWAVKTMSDTDAGLVGLTPEASTIAQLRSLPRPSSLPSDRRLQPTEVTTFVVRGRVTDFKLEDDRDIHVVIATSGNAAETMIIELVDVACDGANRSVQRAAMQTARDAFLAICGRPTTSFKSCNAEVEVTGVGFFDFLHGQRGLAPNGIELHPVLDVRLIGASSPVARTVSSPTPGGSCEPSYPTVCIPPPPPDLDCADIHRPIGAGPRLACRALEAEAHRSGPAFWRHHARARERFL